jgi:hypothetical protein
MSENDDFLRRVGSLSMLKAPDVFVKKVRSSLKDDATSWMERQALGLDELSSAAFTALAAMSVASLILTAVFSIIFSGLPLMLMLIAFAVLPPLSAVSIVQTPMRLARKEESAMLVESPSVVGMMSMSMHISPSLERAVSYASSHGNGTLSKRLRKVSWNAMADWRDDLGSELMELTSSLSDSNRNLKQSLQMLLTATSERSRIGMERLLDKANDLVVQGVREKMDQYVTSLSFPTMVLFAFGVLLPVMLFSLVPMFTMKVVLSSETEVAPALGFEQVAFLMLVLFPSCTFLFAQSTLAKHPLRIGAVMTKEDKKQLALVFCMAIASGLVASFIPLLQPFVTLGAVAAVPSGFILWRWRAEHAISMKGDRIELEFILALFQVGNCMLSGSSLESAVITSSKVLRSEAFRAFSSQVIHRVRTEGLTMAQAFQSNDVLSGASPLVRNAYVTIAESSVIDPESAGRTAVNLAKYLSELRDSERKGRERMRSVVDMMSYTSMLFAPIVIGVTGSLFDLVSGITGSEGSDILTLIGGLYTIELCVVVSYFNGGLLGNRSVGSTAYDFARRAPVAVASFCLTSAIAGQSLTALF